MLYVREKQNTERLEFGRGRERERERPKLTGLWWKMSIESGRTKFVIQYCLLKQYPWLAKNA